MKDVFKLLLFLLLSAFNFNLVLKPLQIVVGGTQGLALIINAVSTYSPSLIVLVINLLMFIICLLLLNKKVTTSIIISTFIYPFLIKLTSFLNSLVIRESFWLVVLSGILSGITLGFTLKLNYSTGGLNIIVLVLKKYFNIKESLSNFIINSLIIILGMKLFGFHKAMIGILIIIINSITVNIILKDVKNCKIT